LAICFAGNAQLKEKNPAEAEYTKKLTINSIRDYLPGKHIKQRVNFGGEYLFYSRLYFPKIDWRKVDCTAEVELGSEKIKEFRIKSEGKKDVVAFQKLVFELCGSYENPRKTANGNFYFWNWYDGFGQLRGELSVDTLNHKAEFMVKPIF
jgi:hypothetical protein